MRKLKKLFKKRKWQVSNFVDINNHGYLECEGNYFQFIISVIRLIK